jgi:hypothetical protein
MATKGNSLDFYCNHYLLEWVRKLEKSGGYELIFGVFVFLFFSFLMFWQAGGNFIWFLVGIFGLSFYVGIYIYGGTFRRARIVNCTIQSLKFGGDFLSIVTFPFRIPGIRIYLKREVILKKGKITISECDFPIKDKSAIKQKAICIRAGDSEMFYCLSEFFSDDLRSNLIDEGDDKISNS